MRPVPTDLCAPVQVLTSSGLPLHCYDDGAGPLWLLYDSMGVSGVIRAQTFEDAHSIAEDEFYPEADFPTWEAIAKDCDVTDPETLMDSATFQECYGFRPNGRNDRDTHGHGIYAKDLNGDGLVELTQQTLERFQLRMVLAD